VRSVIADVLDQIDEEQRLAGAVEEGGFPDEAIATYQHLIEIGSPRRLGSIAEDPVEMHLRTFALDAGTDVRVRLRERLLAGGHVKVVVATRSHDERYGAERRNRLLGLGIDVRR